MIQGTIDFAKPSRPQITSLSRNYLTLDDHTFTKDLEYAFTDFPYESCLDEQVSFYHHTITMFSTNTALPTSEYINSAVIHPGILMQYVMPDVKSAGLNEFGIDHKILMISICIFSKFMVSQN